VKIVNINAREIFDSRACPTVECEIKLENGVLVRASVPSGISKSTCEAVELRDGGLRLDGNGVETTVEIIQTLIRPELIGKEPEMVSTDLWMIEMDGTENKSKLGANTMLAVSIAMCKAQAAASELEPFEFLAHLCDFETVSLPVPMFNMINGGLHAYNKLTIQEFLLIPTGRRSYKLCLEAAIQLFDKIKYLLEKQGKSLLCGDEGGFASNFNSNIEALDLLVEAIEMVSTDDEGGFVIGLDVAASQLYDHKKKQYHWDHEIIPADSLIEKYCDLVAKYPIYAIEDGLDQNDWDGWKLMSEKLGKSIHLIGDDIFATNPYLIAQGIEKGIADTTIIKPNQIGTITETLQAIKLCKDHGMNTVVSHRSGETEDTFIIDLAVGVSANHIKAGGCSRGERLAKYNHLLRIEDLLMMSLLE
jgi:enolase